MHNVEAVEVFDGVGQIVEHAAGVSLCVSVGRGDGIEQISPLWTKSRWMDGLSVLGTMSGEFVWRSHTQNLTDSLPSFHSCSSFLLKRVFFGLESRLSGEGFLFAQQLEG